MLEDNLDMFPPLIVYNRNIKKGENNFDYLTLGRNQYGLRKFPILFGVV